MGLLSNSGAGRRLNSCLVLIILRGVGESDSNARKTAVATGMRIGKTFVSYVKLSVERYPFPMPPALGSHPFLHPLFELCDLLLRPGIVAWHTAIGYPLVDDSGMLLYFVIG